MSARRFRHIVVAVIFSILMFAATADSHRLRIHAATSKVPVNTSLPTVSGSPSVGSTLTASPGTWTNSPSSYAYQWQRCDSAVSVCTDISGATTTTYTVVSFDVGYRLRVHVTASNHFGSGSATSAATAAVTAPPADTTPPVVTITSGPADGSTTTSTSASFSFTATDDVGVTSTDCSLDGATPTACSSPASYSGLSVAAHTFTVRAHDAAGNTGSASRSWTVSASTGCACGSALPAPLPESTGPVIVGDTTQSLESMFSGLVAGDILELHGGSYGPINPPMGDVAVALNASGTAANPITIESYPGERATIARRIDVYGSYIRIRNVTITRNAVPTDTRYTQSGGSPGGSVGIWLRSGGSHRTLEQSEVYGNTMSGIFGGGTSDQLLANYVHDNGTTPDDHGFYWTGGSSLLANNLVSTNYAFGIQLGYGAAINNTIANNTSVENGKRDPTHPGSGFVTFSGAQPNLFVNNIAANNAEFGFKTYDTTNSLSHDDMFGNPAGATYGTFASNTAPLLSDPLFVGAGDYHLQPTSPAIGYGDPAYTPLTDFDGRTRSSADLGAFGK